MVTKSNFLIDVNTTNRDKSLVNLLLWQRVADALEELKGQGLRLKLFEGWRAPSRQNWLYEQGRSREGKKVTNARAWQSWHQYGLAVDVVFWGERGWTWEGDWVPVRRAMQVRGLGIVKNDWAHYELKPKGMKTKDAHSIVASDGILGLWHIIGEHFD